MSDQGVFGYVGNDLNCYQAWCWRWGHDFGDEVCKRCGDSVPASATAEQADICGDEFSSVEIEGNPPEPFRCGLPSGHEGMHTAQISWGVGA